MVELVQAHATHRFVILDEEEEVPRILVSRYSLATRLLLIISRFGFLSQVYGLHTTPLWDIRYQEETPSMQPKFFTGY